MDLIKRTRVSLRPFLEAQIEPKTAIDPKGESASEKPWTKPHGIALKSVGTYLLVAFITYLDEMVAVTILAVKDTHEFGVKKRVHGGWGTGCNVVVAFDKNLLVHLNASDLKGAVAGR